MIFPVSLSIIAKQDTLYYFHSMLSFICHQPNHAYPMSMMIPASGCEPDLSSVCKRDSSDNVTLRNVIYTLWAVNKECTDYHSSCSMPANCYLVFLVSLAFFGK